jgi:hypothetical protein
MDSDSKWATLAATLARFDYNLREGDRYYGATEPWDAPTCRCDAPGRTFHEPEDDGEVRCWKCGALR